MEVISPKPTPAEGAILQRGFSAPDRALISGHQHSQPGVNFGAAAICQKRLNLSAQILPRQSVHTDKKHQPVLSLGITNVLGDWFFKRKMPQERTTTTYAGCESHATDDEAYQQRMRAQLSSHNQGVKQILIKLSVLNAEQLSGNTSHKIKFVAQTDNTGCSK